MDNNVKIFVSVLALLVVVLIGTAIYRSTGGNTVIAPGKYDQFATCLGEQGAKFYGAFWCPHCRNQKNMFGDSAKLLPYVECSTLDGQNQLAVCTEKNVTTYPTWEFKDGSRLTGEIPLEILAEKTSCELPSDAETPAPIEAGKGSAAE